MIDLRKKISKPVNYWGPIDPINLFESLPVRTSTDVKELWRPQADALREWHDNRSEKDILFKLNTGSGKTLIGLLAAQSLVNETHGKVLYVCATNQLVEQTRDKAQEYGLDIATYYLRQWWMAERFDRCLAPCITNYQALMNGKSKFERESIDAVVFDDAHTANNVVLDQFTLKIDKSKMESAYDSITALCSQYYRDIDRAQTFYDVMDGKDSSAILFVPSFISASCATDFRDILIENAVDQIQETLFVWEYLKDKLHLCMTFISSHSIHFTPPLPPVHTLNLFSDKVRRLYLSATMPRNDEIYRTFGREPSLTIKPGGRAGDCERMMLPQPIDMSDSEARQWVQDATIPKKVLVMVPSHKNTGVWKEFGNILTSEDGNEGIRQFAVSSNAKLVLVARYDGIDLPGEACRVLVVDGLPSGLGLMSKFYEQALGIIGITNTAIASRFVQILGRTSRGLTDYGVVILIGQQLLRWISDPRNRQLLPPHIQKQLAIGDKLGSTYDDETTLPVLIDMCLNREDNWVSFYNEEMSENSDWSSGEIDEKAASAIAKYERSFIRHYWEGDYVVAARSLNQLVQAVQDTDKGLAAWYKHLLGFCLQKAGNQQESLKQFREAAAMRSVLGRIPQDKPDHKPDIAISEVSQQADIMAELIKSQQRKVIRTLEKVTDELIDDSSSGTVEECVRSLGEMLGFQASRPDHEDGTGPDDLWLTPDGHLAIVIEVKHNKTTEYTKEEVGVYHQHIQWVSDRHPETQQQRLIIGPKYRCTSSAVPPPDLKIVSLAEIQRIAKDILIVYRNALSQGLDLYFTDRIEAEIRLRSLAWKELIESADAVDILNL